MTGPDLIRIAGGALAIVAICISTFSLMTVRHLRDELAELFFEMQRRRRLGDTELETKLPRYILGQVNWYIQLSIWSGGIALAAAFMVLYGAKY